MAYVSSEEQVADKKMAGDSRTTTNQNCSSPLSDVGTGRIEVILQKAGVVLTQLVDLSLADGYSELFRELERAFEMTQGEFGDDELWQVAYSDYEGDILLLGDDPWVEFCSMARKIHILRSEDVEASNQARLSRGIITADAAAEPSSIPLTITPTNIAEDQYSSCSDAIED